MPPNNIEQVADYLLVVKGNQETLRKDIQAVVEDHWELLPQDLPSESFAEQENTGHGCKEYRCCWVFDQLDRLSTHGQWDGLKQFGVVQADRTVNGKVTTALRLYIISKSMTALETLSATLVHGKSRITSIGCWISLSMKMPVRPSMKMRQKACRY